MITLVPYFRFFKMISDQDSRKNVTPPSSPTIKDGDVFKSPTSSISAESGIDMKEFNPVPLSLPKFTVTRASTVSVDSVFNEAFMNNLTTTSNNRSEKTAWETVYAIQERRKLVKPTFQGAVYNFLERPRGWKSISYHCVILLAVLICLAFSVLTSVIQSEHYGEAQFYMEIALVIFLSTEYIARLWSAGCRSKYLGLWGRLRFATKPISIIDLVIIVASLFVIIFGSNGHVFATSAIRGVRFLQILRMLHMDRQGGSWRLLGSVMYMHRQELLTSLYIGLLGLVFSSYFMYLVEKDTVVDGQPSDFSSYADALWWGVVTMMTIGYGDKVPRTWAGRSLACISAMFTVSFFALPAGILGSGFALKVQQQQRQKHFSRQIPAAATLIQCLWRCYAADKKFNSVATWEMYLNRNVHSTTSKFKYNGLRLRRPKNKNSEGNRTSYGDGQKSPKSRESYGEIAVELGVSRHGLIQSRSVPDMMIVMQEDGIYQNKESGKNSLIFHSPSESVCDAIFDEAETESQDSPITTLTENYKNAIRAIRKIKYFVAKRKFQQARKPYDVGDVIEQYSQGQLSMMVRIKELQRRLDQVLGKPTAPWGDKTGKPVTIGNKLHQLETQVQRLDKRLENLNNSIYTLTKDLANYHRSIEDSTLKRTE